MKRKISFRADASSTIGYGHFVRTLALADMLKDTFDCTFYTTNPSPYQIEELDAVCRYVVLHEEEKFDKFLSYLNGTEIVVLDNYFFTQEYEQSIRKTGAKVVLIDNLHLRHSVADAIIGFAVGLSKESYSVEPYTKLYLGAKYTLLRKPFLEQTKREHKPVSDDRHLKILLSMGGSDMYGISERLIELLCELPNSDRLTVICGDGARFDKQKHEKVRYTGRLTSIEMCQLFSDNDIAILPSSTTTIEALACGIPVLGGYFVDNQLYYYNQCVKRNYIIGFGDLKEEDNLFAIKKYIETWDSTNLSLERNVIPSNIKETIISLFNTL